MPKIIKPMPPARSFFQEIISHIIRMIEGTLCITNPIIILSTVLFSEKTSREKSDIKHIVKITIPLLSQNVNFSVFI